MTTRPLVILGTGRIARTLLSQLLARAGYLRARYALELPVAAAANSRLFARGAPYLEADELARISAAGLQRGEQMPSDPPDRRAYQQDALAGLARAGAERPIVVDLTASDGMAPVLLAALDAGCDVVLANKKPLCEDYDTFERLTCHARGRIGYEVTAGAGLPLVETLRDLYAAGDALIEATACLSGTLGYVCTELEDGRPLSAIVPEALARGFTEPDPRDDLSGIDVRRKALILARTMGQRLELNQVPGTPVIPLEEGSLDAWLAGLAGHDRALDARARGAREQGMVLRYVARILPDGCDVGLREVPRTSAVGRLRGPDNILTVYTTFYEERPLTISGPGAGPQVTAAGVFGDILRLARSQ